MANFTALKTAINNAIKTNGNEEITGAILQAILDAMVETLGDSAINDLENAITTEVTNRENAVGGVAADLAAEALARANKDNQLDNRINAEESNRAIAEAALSHTMEQGFQTLGSQMTALNAAISALNAAYQNGFLYGGIATPSSSPSNNKCFYIALQGGTYTNFGGVGVVEGINIIKNDSGWKVEHIYDQTTLLNEFYLLRQQVIRAISSIDPIVIQGDVTNAPDEEDLTSDAQNLLKFKDRAYSPLNFSGLGMKILRKNIAPLSDSAAFNGFVEGVTAEETLAGTPELIFWDRMNTRFFGIKDGIYYAAWTDDDNYVPVSTSLVYMYNGTPYQWTGSDFIVDETEVPNLVNCLTQDMINEANTIYIIRYDYTLKEDITIPANCVLQFDGGSLKGGTITLNNTGFIVNSENPCFDNIRFVGISSTKTIKASWFKNSLDVVYAAELICQNNGMLLIDKNISMTHTIYMFNGGNLKGAGGKITFSAPLEACILCGNKLGEDSYTDLPWYGTIDGLVIDLTDYKYCIAIVNGYDCVVKNCLINDTQVYSSWYSGKVISRFSNANWARYNHPQKNICFLNNVVNMDPTRGTAETHNRSFESISLCDDWQDCKIIGNVVTGSTDDFAVHNGKGVIIQNNLLKMASGRLFCSDSEDVIIDNNILINQKYDSMGIFITMEYETIVLKNIKVTNNTVKAESPGILSYGIRIANGKGLVVSGNTIEGNISIEKYGRTAHTPQSVIDAHPDGPPFTDEELTVDDIIIENNIMTTFNGEIWNTLIPESARVINNNIGGNIYFPNKPANFIAYGNKVFGNIIGGADATLNDFHYDDFIDITYNFVSGKTFINGIEMNNRSYLGGYYIPYTCLLATRAYVYTDNTATQEGNLTFYLYKRHESTNSVIAIVDVNNNDDNKVILPSPIKFDKGDILYISGLDTNITTLKKNEITLRLNLIKDY